MTIHKLRIDKDRVTPDVLEVGTEGSFGFDYVMPAFSPEWRELNIKAVFHPKRGKPVEVVYTGKPVLVPVEIMRHFGDGSFIFSGYTTREGENGTEYPKLKTVPVVLKVLHTLDDNGGNSIPDTPGTYEQLREAFLADLEKGIDDALEQAKESGEFDGPPGVGLPGPAGPPGLYMLAEGETIEDVPEEYDAAVDPWNPMEVVIFDRGILAILRTAGDGTPGSLDTYTIYYSDETSTEYTVYNGKDGRGLVILGYYDTYDALVAAVTEPEAGDAYGVGTEAPYDIFVWDMINGVWRNNGDLTGVQGNPGKSVEMQVSGGFVQWRQEGGAWTNLLALSDIAGRGILSIERTAGDGSPGTADTYTITFTDNTTLQYQVTNGANAVVTDTVAEGSEDAVTSDAVYRYVQDTIYGFLAGSS